MKGTSNGHGPVGSVGSSDPDLEHFIGALAPNGESGLGVAVIGYGYWGPNLVRNFSETPGARVVGVSDLDADRLPILRARVPHAMLTTDYQDLLSNPETDAVVIATPVATHFDLAMAALEAGKHVLVTKPMTQTAAQAERLIARAAELGLTLMVDHTFVYHGAVQKIEELVRSDHLGRLLYYDSVRVNLGLFQSDVDVLWDLAVHDLSIMDHVVGRRPIAVAATGARHVSDRPHNMAYLTCFFEGDLIAHLHVNWLAPVKVRRTLIGGDRKMIVYDDLEPSEKIKIYDRGITFNNGADREGKFKLMVGYRSGDMWVHQTSITEALRVEAQHFVQCVGERRRPLTDGEAGLTVIRILEAATESMARRGQPIDLEWKPIAPEATCA